MPAAPEAATAVETTETATRMAETSDMCDTRMPVGEISTPVMRSTEAAIDTYRAYAAETHTVMEDGPISAGAVIEAAMVRVATKYGGVAVIAVIIPA